MSGTLWLVATPIGNLGDLSPRAVEVLDAVALVCCEDTRRTGTLLRHAGIHADRLIVTNEHTEHDRIVEILGVLGDGHDVAVVSDAGTPGISDPGSRIVRAAVDAGHVVSAVPGPVAAVTALTVSGLPTERFVFEGFLPRKGRERRDRLAEVARQPATSVIYESPKRVEQTLRDLADVCGADRAVAVCRELTKVFETIVRGPVGEIEIDTPKGEFVIVLAGRSSSEPPVTDDQIVAELDRELDAGSSRRDAVDAVAARLGASRKAVYELSIRGR